MTPALLFSGIFAWDLRRKATLATGIFMEKKIVAGCYVEKVVTQDSTPELGYTLLCFKCSLMSEVLTTKVPHIKYIITSHGYKPITKPFICKKSVECYPSLHLLKPIQSSLIF